MDSEFRLTRGVAERLGYYVYALEDPTTGNVFYVGKGQGARLYEHARASRSLGEGPELRSELRLETIERIRASGHAVRHVVIRHGLTEDAALEVEAALLDFCAFVGVGLTNLCSGHGVDRGLAPMDELVFRFGAQPVEIAHEHNVVLLKAAQQFRLGMTHDEMYETARGWWRVGVARRRQLRHAFVVFNGIVRAVFSIERDGWEQRADGLWAFTGTPSLELEAIYVGRDVAHYFKFRRETRCYASPEVHHS